VATIDGDEKRESEPVFGDWLRGEMERQNITIQDLANKTGLSYPGVWNIVKGNTIYPQTATRKKISEALQAEIPTAIESEIKTNSSVSGYEWTDFSPYDLQTIPELGGIYVFYDITDRPVYVGKSNSNVRGRVRDHQTRFWFKQPLVMRGSFLAVADAAMCDKIEMILIKFLGNHALLNSRGAVKDMEA
jgi:transcriptional regulator with XRE-family HTH domain